MPRLDGWGVLRFLRDEMPQVHAIMLTMYDDELHLRNALLAGAHGYLAKHDDFSELLHAVRVVYEGGIYIDKALAERGKCRGAREIQLTEREGKVLELICSGLTFEQIATRLYLSLKTVEVTRQHLFAKFGVKSRHELAAAAFASGIVPLSDPQGQSPSQS